MTYILNFSQNFSFINFLIICSCLFVNTATADGLSDEITRSRILYLFQTSNEPLALELYQEYYKARGSHDSEILEQIALILIEKGSRSDDVETRILAIFGAGISMNEKMLDILKAGLLSELPQIQLISLNFLTRLHHDEGDLALNRAMSSNFLEIRVEAGFHLAKQKAPKIAGQIESLMCKVDPLLHPLFPQFFGLIGTNEATKILFRLLNHPNEVVRAESIISAAEYQRDDLLPVIKILASHQNAIEQEAASYAFGKMKDESSIERLEKLALSNAQNVRLAALFALYRLGQTERVQEIEEHAKQLDLFAINMLSEMEASAPLLIQLSKHDQLNVRVNALFSLLKLKRAEAMPGLMEILVHDSRDLNFLDQTSLGGTLRCLKTTPSASQNFKTTEIFQEISLHKREMILREALQLPEKEFLTLAKILFETNQNELIPTLVMSLEDIGTKGAINLLKYYSQKTGAPLIRNYCNLALFRLKEEGPYQENLNAFILQQCKNDLINFRPLLPFETRNNASSYQLTPQDTSQLLIQAFEAITMRQDEAGINLLLHAIEHGNQKNKYALAGLLMNAAR